jgi:uncharacterized membrane protein
MTGPAPDDRTPQLPPLPSHVEESLAAIAAMHAAHHEKASALDRAIDRMAAFFARPRFLVYIAGFIALWVTVNLATGVRGGAAFDAAPFPLLSVLVSSAALFIAVLILGSQRRAGRLANLREQMTLELALLTDQKTTKLIDLMEELRRDLPNVHNRVDLEALEMSGAPDHGTVLQAIQDITDGSPAAT